MEILNRTIIISLALITGATILAPACLAQFGFDYGGFGPGYGYDVNIPIDPGRGDGYGYGVPGYGYSGFGPGYGPGYDDFGGGFIL